MNHKIHFRRCQHCGMTHHSDDELVIDCGSCGKELIPLYYTKIVQYAQEECTRSAALTKDNPVMMEILVVGLTADWEAEPDAI